MKRRLCLSLLICVACLLARGMRAQSTIELRDTATRLNITSHSTTQGRDFWLAPILCPGIANYNLFINCSTQTTAYIELPGAPIKQLQVSPLGPTLFAIPLSAILATSDTVERKGIHVWCNSGDLIVTFLPSTTSLATSYIDGANIPPVTAWDTDYVIAAGPTRGYSSYVTIVANSDSTRVTVVPSCDISLSTGSVSTHGPEKRKPTTCMLMRGEAVQYWSFTDTSLTGTTVRASKPVGVMTGSSYLGGIGPRSSGPFPNIESMLPRRSWGNDYYTASYGRTSIALVASQDSQLIRRTGREIGLSGEQYTVAKKNDVLWLDRTDSATRWTSDAPFMMVCYTTSGGGPSVVLQPRAQWQRTVRFHVPSGYSPTANVFVNRAAKFVTLDGIDLKSGNRVHVDSEMDCITFVEYAQGAHVLQSDSALGMYITSTNQYYSSAFAFGVNNGLLDNSRGDTAAPILTFDSSWYCRTVHIADHTSGLFSLLIDSAHNFSVSYDSGFRMIFDSVRWPDGQARGDTLLLQGIVATRDSASISICLIDSLSAASYAFTVFDRAGNAQHYSISYVPNPRFFHPGYTTYVEGLDSCLIDQFEDFYIDATDTSLMRVEIDRLWTDSPFFTFDPTSYAENVLPFNVMPGATHGFRLRFAPTEQKTYSAHAYLHSPFAGTMEVPLECVAYPWQIGPVDAVRNERAPAVHCYPNPASHFVVISTSEIQPVTFEMFNSLGELVRTEHWQEAAAEHLVSLSDLPSGIYNYRLTTAGSGFSGKLVVATQ